MSVFSARRFWLPVLLTTLVAALFGAVLGRRGRRLDAMLDGEVGLQVLLHEVQRENRKELAQRDALLSSPEAIEKAAREDLGLAAPGETVVPFEGGPRPRVSRERTEDRRPVVEGLLSWRQLPLALPAAVFVLSAVVFALWNLGTGNRRTSAPPEPEAIVEPDQR